ncbi:MAG: UDP-N-acetylmuramate--L-alanine ligase [Chloroflexota bacterium]|jgi:UDP-N-acetylmuramate--alanine ligase
MVTQFQINKDAGLLANISRVHFVGIGGIGMSALAELLLAKGKTVTGSDVKGSDLIERLKSLGIAVNIGHSAEAVLGADLVVFTSAARPDNPELEEAKRRGIKTIKRAELLGWVMNESFGLAVAGTHGKTTTTSMLAYILQKGGMDPTALIGGEPLDFPSHGLMGNGHYLVAEADEFDRSFLQLWPKVAIITSIEADHLDCYTDLDDIKQTFLQFASRIPADGLLVTCSDDPILRDMKLPVPRQSYGVSPGSDWLMEEYQPLSPYGTSFSFTTPSGNRHTCTLQLSGHHYALNALGAIAAANAVGIDSAQASSILASFRGTRRRYELTGEAWGVAIIDDYAHHPTAVQATLKAARERHRDPIRCVFQPHTTNRTEKLLKEFSEAFDAADHVLILPIYRPAGREEGESISSRDLVARMHHPDVRHVGSLPEAAAVLESEVAKGDLVITMGAGDVFKVGEHVLCRLKKKEAAEKEIAERPFGRPEGR